MTASAEYQTDAATLFIRSRIRRALDAMLGEEELVLELLSELAVAAPLAQVAVDIARENGGEADADDDEVHHALRKPGRRLDKDWRCWRCAAAPANLI